MTSLESATESPSEAERDEGFRVLVARASEDGHYDFTENQLYARYARGRSVVTRFISRRGKFGLLMLVIGIAIWLYGLKTDTGVLLIVGIAITLGGVAQVGTGVITKRDPAAREAVFEGLSSWLEREPQPRLLRGPTLANAGLEYAPQSVTCVLVVERDLVVDLLLKNGAHQALNALVISEAGYPSALTAEAQRLLDERSDLKVIALHDATEAGVGLHSRLLSNEHLALTDHAITDVGLFASEVGNLEELASVYPAAHFTRVPVDALRYSTLLVGLKGVLRGAPTISEGVYLEEENHTASREQAA